MNQYVDILFALYMSDEPRTLEWLTEFIGHTEKHSQRYIKTLISAGLISLYLSEKQVYAELTEKGTEIALRAADILSSRIIEQWWRTVV